jgi:hypothetical protein
MNLQNSSRQLRDIKQVLYCEPTKFQSPVERHEASSILRTHKIPVASWETWRKFHTADPRNFCRQFADIKQAPYCRPTNIRRHRTKFSRPGDLLFWICAPLFTVCSVPRGAHYTNPYTTNKNIYRRNSSETVRLMKEDVMGINCSEQSSKQAVLPHR